MHEPIEERGWVSHPELAEERVREATGHGWDEWCELIEAWPGSSDGHAAVAAWLHAEHGVDPWWAQGVTVGWERITGRRQPGQMADGTFTANASRRVEVDAPTLRAALLDDAARTRLLGGVASTLRSRATSTSLRFGLEVGVALIAMDPLPDGRTAVTVAHEKLPSAAEVATAKAFWAGWLASLPGGLGDG